MRRCARDPEGAFVSIKSDIARDDTYSPTHGRSLDTFALPHPAIQGGSFLARPKPQNGGGVLGGVFTAPSIIGIYRFSIPQPKTLETRKSLGISTDQGRYYGGWRLIAMP